MEEAKVFTNNRDVIVGYSKTTTTEDDGSVSQIEIVSGKVTDNEIIVDSSVLDKEVIGQPVQAIDQIT